MVRMSPARTNHPHTLRFGSSANNTSTGASAWWGGKASLNQACIVLSPTIMSGPHCILCLVYASCTVQGGPDTIVGKGDLPSCNGRESGIPWQTTSFTEVQQDLGKPRNPSPVGKAPCTTHAACAAASISSVVTPTATAAQAWSRISAAIRPEVFSNASSSSLSWGTHQSVVSAASPACQMRMGYEDFGGRGLGLIGSPPHLRRSTYCLRLAFWVLLPVALAGPPARNWVAEC
jgi:hypothetical protein